jgi:hypothetical protein
MIGGNSSHRTSIWKCGCFKGNVVAVQTASYWDDDLETLRTRLEALGPKVDAMAAEEVKKNPKMTGEEFETFKLKAQAEHFTPGEWKRLQAGVSNGGYHYLGAAKIMTPIGKAFAGAIVKLQKGNAPVSNQNSLGHDGSL